MTLKMFKSINISFFVLILMGLASCQNSSQKKIIKMAHGMDVSHPVHKAMEYMAHDLDKISEGLIKLEIYPNQQLGTERQLLELLQIGSLGMTKVSAAVMENFSPDMKIFGLPFLFRSKEHLFKVLDGPIGKNLLNESEKYRLKGLGYYDSGSRSFYTKEKPIFNPSDLFPYPVEP